MSDQDPKIAEIVEASPSEARLEAFLARQSAEMQQAVREAVAEGIATGLAAGLERAIPQIVAKVRQGQLHDRIDASPEGYVPQGGRDWVPPTAIRYGPDDLSMDEAARRSRGY